MMCRAFLERLGQQRLRDFSRQTVMSWCIISHCILFYISFYCIILLYMNVLLQPLVGCNTK